MGSWERVVAISRGPLPVGLLFGLGMGLGVAIVCWVSTALQAP